MSRKQRRQKNKIFWSKRKKIAVVTLLTIIGLSLVANAILLYRPPLATVSFPVSIMTTSGSQIPTANFPINKTAASQFVNDTIADYNDLLGSRQETWSNFTSIQRYFDLYQPNGSWVVQVGRDNSSFSDYLEFIFRPTQQNVDPQTVVYTNESAIHLRPVTETQLLLDNIDDNYHKTKYGIILSQYYSEAAGGATTLIPLVWITNSSLVYGDVMVNANNAASSIYQNEVQAMNTALNPHYPSYGWWLNVWHRYKFDIGVVVALALGISGTYGAYLYRKDREGSESKTGSKVQ
jgi:hypothetical protein